MSHYLLSVHMPRGQAHRQPPSPEQMQAMMQGIVALEAEMDEKGAFVFSGRLTGADEAVVVRHGDDGPATIDGPYAETKELIGGFYIIDADDLDAALEWAKKVVNAINAPIEVRPFQATGRAADHLPGA